MTFFKKLLDKGVTGIEDQKDFSELGHLEHPTMHNELAPMFWEKAINSEVFDYRGKKWIDFTSSVAVTNSGHSNKEVCDAIKNAVDHQVISTFTFPNRARLKLAMKLNELSIKEFGEEYACHFLSGGSEAVECALDLATSYYNKDKSVIVSFFNAFHGNTAKSDIISGNEEISTIKKGNKEQIFIKVPFMSRKDEKRIVFTESLGKVLEKHNLNIEDVIAIVLEPYQGRGVYILDKNYAHEIQSYCDKNKILLIIDEIQTGFFRTGKMFASKHFNFIPDILCIGKGFASSLPISGVLAKKEIFRKTSNFEILTSQSANPICCAAALANIIFLGKELSEPIFQKTINIFDQEMQKLSSHSQVSYSDSIGMAGSVHIETNGKPDGKLASKIVQTCFQRGLLINPPNGSSKSYIRLTPPLTISEKLLTDGFRIVNDVISKS